MRTCTMRWNVLRSLRGTKRPKRHVKRVACSWLPRAWPTATARGCSCLSAEYARIASFTCTSSSGCGRGLVQLLAGTSYATKQLLARLLL